MWNHIPGQDSLVARHVMVGISLALTGTPHSTSQNLSFLIHKNEEGRPDGIQDPFCDSDNAGG